MQIECSELTLFDLCTPSRLCFGFGFASASALAYRTDQLCHASLVDTSTPAAVFKWAPSLALWGGAGAGAVMLFMSSVPLFKKDILIKLPVVSLASTRTPSATAYGTDRLISRLIVACSHRSHLTSKTRPILPTTLSKASSLNVNHLALPFSLANTSRIHSESNRCRLSFQSREAVLCVAHSDTESKPNQNYLSSNKGVRIIAACILAHTHAEHQTNNIT